MKNCSPRSRRNGDRVILFLDELQLQSVVGTPEQGKTSHIQGLLKAHIAARDLTIIAAATPEDYYKYIKSDEIMAANFSAILLNEPEKEEMLKILAGVKGYFEQYYGLRIPGRPVCVHVHLCAALHSLPGLSRQGDRTAGYFLLQGFAEKN